MCLNWCGGRLLISAITHLREHTPHPKMAIFGPHVCVYIQYTQCFQASVIIIVLTYATVLEGWVGFNGALLNPYQWGRQLLLISYQPCSAVILQIRMTVTVGGRKNLWCLAKLDLLMMCLTGTHYVKWTSGSCMKWGWETLVLSQFSCFFSEAGPHSRVINRQIREVGSVAWMALTNITAAASLG